MISTVSKGVSKQVTTEELAARYGSAYKWYVSLTVLVGLIAMIASATIVNVAMPDIMGEFGMGQDQAQWLATAFLASMTATMLAASWATRAFGSRGAYSLALIAFAVGSLIGAFSPNDSVLIIARIIQGAAAGVTQSMGTVTMFQAFPANQRGSAMGFYGMGVILAPALGPTAGGMLVDNYSWHYVFFLGLPFCALALPLALTFLPTTRDSKPPPFDWLGFILLTGSIAAFLTGLSNGQRQGWDSAFVVWSFCLAIIAMIAFVAQERRTATPLLALGVFRNPRFVGASAVAFIYGVGVFGSTYLVPLFLQTVQGYTPTDSGLLLMPAGIALGIVFPVSGRMSDRLPPHILIVIGMAVFALSSYLMAQVGTDTPFWTFAGYVAIGRIGMGLILPSLNSGALRVLDQELISHGAGAVNFSRQLGGAVGVDLLSVYLERQTTFYAHEINAMQTGSSSGTETLHLITAALHQAGLSGATAVHQAHQFLSTMISAQASVMGFRESFLFVAVISFVALFPAWYMRAKRLPG